MTPPIVLKNGILRVTLTPGLGGTITSIRHLGQEAEILARTPWVAETTPLAFAPDEASWLTRFSGGWPMMFPNGGDACDDGAARHGFHGEGSVSPWDVDHRDECAIISRRFRTVPATMTRQISLAENCLAVEETVVAHGACRVVWGQHVTFGGDLLARPVTLHTSATRLDACAVYDPPANPLIAGASGDWPILPGRHGEVSLVQPPDGASALACLSELGAAPWAELRRRDESLSVRLDWSADPWPRAWLWVETGGTTEAPWHGKGRMIAIEPCTTWPATGLVAAEAAGGHILTLADGETRQARITLTVVQPESEA